MASSSSAQSNHHQMLLRPSFTATPAPPPTPSNHHHPYLFPSSDSDAFSRLLHNHLNPPALLSLPSRFRPKTATINSPPPPPPPIPTIAFGPNLSQSLASASLPAFFQLTHHPIPPHLPKSAELQSLSLFEPNSTHAHSNQDTWPLGFDDDDDEAEPSFRFDPASPSSSSAPLSSLKELAEALEKVGMDVVEALSHAVGFNSPMHEKGRGCSMMWVSLLSSSRNDKVEYEDGDGEAGLDPGKVYPYVVGLEYQIRRRKYLLLADSGWVYAEPDVDSILVTVGDIAQVWSNGRLRKIRGRPLASSRKEDGSLSSSSSSPSVSMCLLVTLSMDSIISPLLPLAESKLEEDRERNDGSNDDDDADKGIRVFHSISFEEYAWRVYHERFLYKDPLDRYRL